MVSSLRRRGQCLAPAWAWPGTGTVVAPIGMVWPTWHRGGTRLGVASIGTETVWCRLSGLGWHRLGLTPTTGRKWAWRGSGRVAKLCGEVCMGIGWISYLFCVYLWKNARNSQSTINNQQSAISNQLSAFSNQQSAINNQLSAFSNQQSAINNQLTAFSNQQSAINNQLSAVSVQRMSDKNNAKAQKTLYTNNNTQNAKNSKKQRKNALQRKTRKNSKTKKQTKNKVVIFVKFVFVFVVFMII